MVYSPRILALLLAFGIAFIITLLLFLFGADSHYLLLTFISGLIVSFLLVFIALEFLVFREIKKIHKLMRKLKKRELNDMGRQSSLILNPFKVINEEIFSFADLKQKEIDELKKIAAFRKEFIADVSHELKTPIFSAQGFLHTLLDGAVHDKNVREKFLEKAAKSIDALDMLVQDLLTLSNIETGRIQMNFENIDLYQLASETFEQLETNAAEKNVRLRVDSAARPVIAYADRQRISQVMTNLVSNAINHSFEGAEVVVGFKAGKKNITTSVIDTGEGILREHLSRIFERFYRIDKSRSRGKGGTGLGLAIVKHILERHHSRVRVESSPGKGSTFWFKLPRTQPGNEPVTLKDSSQNIQET